MSDLHYQPENLFSAKVLADSMWLPTYTSEQQLRMIDHTARARRITTFELVFPRCVLAEFNTHCQVARNSASSRARPVEKMLAEVMEHPFVPLQVSKAGKGMSAAGYWVPGDPEYDDFAAQWLKARDKAVDAVKGLLKLGVHKQDANRILEPFMWHTVVATATWEKWDWPNFIRLRADERYADPKISPLAIALRDAAEQSLARDCSKAPEWHLPLIGFPGDEQLGRQELIKVSIARVARTSYLTHDGTRDVDADLAMFEKLRTNGHLSPAEQIARPEDGRHAKYTGWRSARTWIENGLEVEV